MLCPSIKHDGGFVVEAETVLLKELLLVALVAEGEMRMPLVAGKGTLVLLSGIAVRRSLRVCSWLCSGDLFLYLEQMVKKVVRVHQLLIEGIGI